MPKPITVKFSMRWTDPLQRMNRNNKDDKVSSHFGLSVVYVQPKIVLRDDTIVVPETEGNPITWAVTKLCVALSAKLNIYDYSTQPLDAAWRAAALASKARLSVDCAVDYETSAYRNFGEVKVRVTDLPDGHSCARCGKAMSKVDGEHCYKVPSASQPGDIPSKLRSTKVLLCSARCREKSVEDMRGYCEWRQQEKKDIKEIKSLVHKARRRVTSN